VHALGDLLDRLGVEGRLVTRPWSTWTSSSTQVPPAFSMSVRMLGQEVKVRPLTTPASTSVHAPWQMDATGLPVSKNERTKRTASRLVRRESGLATPPGSTRPS
jgi:single-stranded DNA-binding protein